VAKQKELGGPNGHLASWYKSPATMVRELFGVNPDAWQEEVLETFRETPRIALLASKGVGKTTLLAWIIWNFMLTRVNPKIACISVSGDNLRDNLWTELALWASKAPLIQGSFTITKTRIFLNERPDIWWASARSWSANADRQQQASALSGLHSENILFIIDESGSMPDGILASAENALSTCVEGHIVQAGNPEKLEGPLYRAYKSPDAWKVVPINGDPDNPKRSPRVSIEWAREQIKQWGKDNDYVKINVYGTFPASSLNALIGPEEVEAAMKRFYREHDIRAAAKIMGVDVARQGDDASVLAKRQGLQMWPFIKRRGLDSNQGASLVAREWDSWGVQACFLDATGGFGFGWMDQLSNLGKAAIPVQFAGQAHSPDRFKNKRSEMAWDFVHWIKNGGALPDSPELAAALTRTTYSHDKDKLFLEPKEMVKAKIGYSPDEFDAAMLTFAEPVTPMATTPGSTRNQYVAARYNQFADLDRISGQEPRGAYTAYDPFRN
jgi:phage terminase large subunit